MNCESPHLSHAHLGKVANILITLVTINIRWRACSTCKHTTTLLKLADMFGSAERTLAYAEVAGDSRTNVIAPLSPTADLHELTGVGPFL